MKAMATALGLLAASCVVVKPPVRSPSTIPNVSPASGVPVPSPTPAFPADPIGQAHAVSSQATLRQALSAANIYFAENGTFDTFTPDVASQLEPNITWNAAQVAIGDEVSVRANTTTSVVLATKDASDNVWCVAYDSASNVTNYGQADATTFAGCTGGWPGL